MDDQHPGFDLSGWDDDVGAAEDSSGTQASGALVPRNYDLGQHILVALLERLIGLTLTDQQSRDEIFKELCEHLERKQIISRRLHRPELASLRSHALGVMFAEMSRSVGEVRREESGPLSLSLIHPLRVEPSAGITVTTNRYAEEFLELGHLGKGGFGTVYKAKNKLDQHEYAVKKIKFRDLEHVGECSKILREVKVLSSLSHKNVLGYRGSWMEYTLLEAYDSDTDEGELTVEEDSIDIHQVQNSTLGEVKPKNYLALPNLRSGTSIRESHQLSATQEEHGDDLQVSFRSEDVLDDGRSGGDGAEEESETESRSIPIEASNGTSRSGRTGASDRSERSGPLWGTSPDEATPPSDRPVEWSNGDVGRVTSWEGGWGEVERVRPATGLGDTDGTMVVLPQGRTHFRSLPNVVPGVVLYIQTELCQNTLRDLLDERNEAAERMTDRFSAVDEDEVLGILKQVLRGMVYIHSKSVMHRDLNPRNIFLTTMQDEKKRASLRVQIGDFGLARDEVAQEGGGDPLTPFEDPGAIHGGRERHILSNGVGTVTYLAPEQKNASHYDSKCDLYSLGLVVLELYQPFVTDTEKHHVFRDARDGRLPGEFRARWPHQADLICRLLACDPCQRPSAAEILRSRLFPSPDDVIKRLKEELAEKSRELLRKDEELQRKDQTILDLRQAVEALKSQDIRSNYSVP